MDLLKILQSKKGKDFMTKHSKFFFKTMIGGVDEFLESVHNPRKFQERCLLNLIEENKNTDFGREHHFDKIKTVEDFQKNVPIMDYEDLRPYIEKVIYGNTKALFSQKPLMFLKTSGTTDKPKYIPVTKQSKQENKTNFQIWIYYTVIDHPNLVGGTTLNISSPTKEGRIGKYPFSSYSGWIRDNQPILNKLFYAIPEAIYEIEDENLRYYSLIRCSIEQNITMINTANSSTVLNLARKADEKKEILIKDVRDGKISSDSIIETDKRILKKLHFKPNPDKARELEEIVNETGRLLPKDYWENLVVIGCWKGGSQSIFYSQFNEYYGQVPVRDLGILASEGRMTIPIRDKGSSGVLDISHTFFEFIPDNEIEKQNPQVLRADELEKNEIYFILMTTSGGLYRYNIGDRVKVTGFYENAPELCFLDKGKHCSSLTGEKLTEYQTVLAMRNLNTGIDEFVLHPAMDNEASIPYYKLLIEETKLEDLDVDKFQLHYDKELRKINPEYDSKRKTRLDSIRIKSIPDGTFRRFKSGSLSKRGIKTDIQYKHQFLNPTLNFDGELE